VVAVAEPKVEIAPVAAVEKPIVENPVIAAPVPAQYFRNFQLFESRVVALSEVGKTRLREWTQHFKKGGYQSVSINGYTDNIPPQRLKAQYATNEILSEARAKMVAEYLVSQGIDSRAITVKGMGDINPVASNENEEGRSKNRRVEFILAR
jgi:OOP family OmpA-OmpF porin